MKIHGKPIKGPQEEILVIPRSKIVGNETEQEDYVFIARAVLDFKEFEALVPIPKPPFLLRAGKSESNFQDVDYLKKLEDWNQKKMDWIVLKALEPSPGLEWEKVNLKDPSTWRFYEEELLEAGFNKIEVVSIQNLAVRVNSLDDVRVEEGRKRFLASKGVEADK